MMKINWIYPELNMSGGARSNHLVAEAMVRRGHEVRIVYSTVTPCYSRRKRLQAWMNSWLPWGRSRRAAHPLYHLEGSVTQLVPVHRRPIPASAVPDADVSIATWWETREWLQTWPASKGVKAYFVRHHELFGGDPDRVAATYRMSGPKFVISSWLGRVMAEQYDDPDAVLVPNGVDRRQFDSSPRPRPEAPTVGFLYKHTRWKGTPTAVQAVARLRQRLPELRVVTFGMEPMTAEDARLTEAEHTVNPPQSRIPEIYQQATCWVVPSISEGFGMLGLEAAASHTPIVSTRCGGPEDYVQPGVNGELVPVNDPDAMADAIERVLTLDEAEWEAWSRASYAISRKFDWDESAAILEKALDRAVAG